MNEVQFLFFVLAALYVLQCIAWAPAASEIFRVDWRYRAKVIPQSVRRRSGRNRFYFLNPFSPVAGAVVCEPFPSIRINSDAQPVVAPPSKGDEFAGHATICLSEQEKQIHFEGKEVRSPNRLLFTAHSEAFAALVAGILDRVRKKPPQERARAFEREFEKMFDTKKISARLEEYRDRAGLLRVAVVVLLTFLFLLAPFLIRFWGLERIWPLLLAYLVWSLGWVGWSFWRLHRQLYAEVKEGRWQQVMVHALSPFSAIRANDLLLRDLFCAFHPVAVGHVLMSNKESRAQAERLLRQAVFRSDQSADSSDASMRRALENFLKKNEMPREELLQAPKRESENCQTYCPLCLAQFVLAEGQCPDCGDVPLKKL